MPLTGNVPHDIKEERAAGKQAVAIALNVSKGDSTDMKTRLDSLINAFSTVGDDKPVRMNDASYSGSEIGKWKIDIVVGGKGAKNNKTVSYVETGTMEVAFDKAMKKAYREHSDFGSPKTWKTTAVDAVPEPLRMDDEQYKGYTIYPAANSQFAAGLKGIIQKSKFGSIAEAKKWIDGQSRKDAVPIPAGIEVRPDSDYSKLPPAEARAMAKAAFHGWVRANVPNGKNWRDCNPPARVVEAEKVANA